MTDRALSQLQSAPASILPDSTWRVGAAAGLLLLAVALFHPSLLSDPDTYWHLSAGDWMLAHRVIPHADLFSFTRAGAPWHPNEWLTEVLMAAAFRLGGWTGLVTLFGLVLATAVLLLNDRLRRSLSGISLTLTLTLVLACMGPSLLARPHVLILPILVAWTAALLRAREARRAPPLWAAALMLPWANLHGSFVLGFPLLGAFGLEALLEAAPGERWRVARDWGVFAALSLIAAMITPQGPAGLAFPFVLMSSSSLPLIVEWLPMDFSKISLFEVTLAIALFASLSRGMKVPPIRLLLLIGLLHMALQHSRFVIIMTPLAAMLLAAPLAAALGQTRPELKPVGNGAWLAFGFAALALIAVRGVLPVTRVDGPTTPGAALNHVPVTLRARPVFNDYGFGGYLIYRGVRPYIDGRWEPYGDAFIDRYREIVSPDPAALDQTLRDYNIAWTILPPGAPVVALMDARPGWRRLYADRFAVIHERLAQAGRKAGP